MKYLFFLSLLLLVSTKTLPQAPNGYSAGFSDSLKSTILNEKRQLLIYTPYAEEKRRTNTNKRYPVLYVLDGENHFKAVAAIVQQLAAYGSCPEIIVVGIINTDRGRDLTPSPVNTGTDAIKNSGGGEKFTSFLERELIPYINQTYSTAPYQILMGHSLGGLMAINTIFQHPNLFNTYIAIDAAIWWDGHKVLDQAKTNLTGQSYNNKTLYLSMANRMEKGIDTTNVQLDTNEATELIRYNLDLIHYLNAHAKNAPRFGYSYYPTETHGTVTFISTYDALRFIFKDFPLPKTKGYQTDNPELTKLITAHSQQISKQLGYQVLPDASTINSLGYRAMALKQLDLAKKLFILNLTNYPDDANLMDSMGDYYTTVNDKANAISWFKKALAIAEIPETRSKLNALKP